MGRPPSLPPLTLDAAAFDLGTPAGTTIGTFRGKAPNTALTVTPQDGRVAIAGNDTIGWSLVVGYTAATVGPFTVSIKEANPQAPGVERVTTLTLRCRKALPTLPLAVGSKLMGIGHSMIQRGVFSRNAGTTLQGHQEASMRAVLSWLKFLCPAANIDFFTSRASTDPAIANGDNVNPFQGATSTNAINGAQQAIGGEHCQFLSIFNPGVLARLAYCIARGPAAVYLHIGENDVNSDGWATADALIAHVDEILKVLRDNGIWVIVQSIQLRAPSLWPAGGTQVQVTQAFNVWLAAQAGRDGVKVCDTRAVISDAVFDGTAFNTTDFIHFNAIGAYRAATVALPIVQAMFAAGSFLNTDPTVSNIFPSPGLLGTTGTRTGANVTGPVATGWSVQNTAGTSAIVCSKEVISGTFEKQVLTITPVNDGTVAHQCKMLVTSVTPFLFANLGVTGTDWIEMLVLIELSAWGCWNGLTVLNEQYTSGNAFVWQANTGLTGDPSPGTLPAGVAFSGWAVTRFPVQPSADRVRYDSRPFILNWISNVASPGVGVAKISQPIFRKIASPLPTWNL